MTMLIHSVSLRRSALLVCVLFTVLVGGVSAKGTKKSGSVDQARAFLASVAGTYRPINAPMCNAELTIGRGGILVIDHEDVIGNHKFTRYEVISLTKDRVALHILDDDFDNSQGMERQMKRASIQQGAYDMSIQRYYPDTIIVMWAWNSATGTEFRRSK